MVVAATGEQQRKLPENELVRRVPFYYILLEGSSWEASSHQKIVAMSKHPGSYSDPNAWYSEVLGYNAIRTFFHMFVQHPCTTYKRL